MYSNQTFDSSGFQNDTNQHLSNMAPSPFSRQSSNYPELTDAEICSMTGQQLDEYYAMVDANQNEPNEVTPYSSQPGRISHTVPATAPSDSFSMQNEYTHPHKGTRGAYPPSSSTARARHLNAMQQDNRWMNDVLEKCNFLCQRLAQAEAKYQKAVSSKPAPCTCHRDGNGGRSNRGGRGQMNRGRGGPTQRSINHCEEAARRAAEPTRENTAPTDEATP